MDVSIFTAFLAGLFSFLSPCVLPLVPGYISMLSGIGVEQLKEGKAPRAGLLVSAVAFVLGFSAVFITFGASASAVGGFLQRNRAALAPIAGALIILFGLHLTGLLAKITVKLGLIIGVILVVLGVALAMRPGALGHSVKPMDFYAGLAGFPNRSIAHALAESRRALAERRRPAWCHQRLSTWLRICIRLDAMHWSCARERPYDRSDEVNDLAGYFPSGLLFGGARPSVPCHRGLYRWIYEVLSELSSAPAHSGSRQWRAAAFYRRFDLQQQIHVAFGQADVPEPLFAIARWRCTLEEEFVNGDA